ncbi:MAG: exodeoxyribonuclease V subunit gamma [Burkholderiaceae bacterium]
MTSTADLTPGFMVLHGDQPESLLALLTQWVARYPLAPLDNEVVLVQSNGVAQWLRRSLAAEPADGGLGVAAALETQLPARFIWDAYRAVLGADGVPTVSPFDRSLLLWRLVRLLPSLLDQAALQDAFAPLARFLSGDRDGRRRYQLAQRVADLFDQYQVYRADWLAAWADGDDTLTTARGVTQPVPEAMRWQPLLWRHLRQDVGSALADSGRADVHRRFLQLATDPGTPRPAGLPARLLVFGISSLPQQSLEVLAHLARWVQVLMFVHNPSRHDWSHIVADRDLLRTTFRRHRPRAGAPVPAVDAPSLHVHGHPLLAAWGKQGRDFMALVDAHDDHERYAARFADIGQRIDCFTPEDRPAPGRLLGQLQDDLLDLRPVAESRALWPPVDAASDDSLRFHVAHSRQREVEVLHDQLLDAFARDATLQPRDVIVMVPEVADYAPHVQAVFGQTHPGDPRHIPFHLVDRQQRRHDPLLGALERLLSLPVGRVTVSEVLDWLEVPALRARFDIDEDSLPLLRRWVAAAQVRWGLHADQRESLGLPALEGEHTWDRGLVRLLLGYAAGQAGAWNGIEPVDEVGGLEAPALGALVTLLQTLEQHWRALQTDRCPADWGVALRALLADCFRADDGRDALTMQRLDGALEDWLQACSLAGLQDTLPLAVVREHWLERLDDSSLQQGFLGGGVTIATLMPMRAIPFRFVALLGMNDGEYPRSRPPMDFDLMAHDWRPGDRSRREDDRYLFLEALLSARDRLLVSWCGRSIHDLAERPPSVLVAQLRDHLAQGWCLPGDGELPAHEAGQHLLQALTLEHRMQPFDPAYYRQTGDPRLFSHAHEWRIADAPEPASGGAGPSRDRGLPLPAQAPADTLALSDLAAFLRRPVRAFLQDRLGVYFDDDDPASDDVEPFVLDGLTHWQLKDELIQAQVAALNAGDDTDTVLQERLQSQIRRGAWPPGAFGALVAEDMAEPLPGMLRRLSEARTRWPVSLPAHELDLPAPAGLGFGRVQGWIDQLWANEAGERCRLVLSSSTLYDTKGNTYRLERLAAFWVHHLAANLALGPTHTCMLDAESQVDWAPLSEGPLQAAWDALLRARDAGMRQPLPLAWGTVQVWLAQQAGDADKADDANAREKARAHYEGGWSTGERDRQAELARVFPDFQALWSDGEFVRWCDALAVPLDQAIPRQGGASSPGSARGRRQGRDADRDADAPEVAP